MKPTFYPFSFLISLPLLACGGEEPNRTQDPQGLGEQQGEGSVFALAPENLHAYTPPASGQPSEQDWAARWVEHLRRGSKDGLDFAKEQLAKMGAPAVPVLVGELEANMSRSGAMGYLVSLCEVLSACGSSEQVPVLLRVLDQNPPPVVRTASYEALTRLGNQDMVPSILERLTFENEAAPREAALRAIAEAGGPQALAYLEQETRKWLAQDPTAYAGDKAFSALLLCEDEGTSMALRGLRDLLPPFQQVQSMGARIRFGDRDLVKELRPFLQEEDYPSAGTRELALQLLGELGDWESVLSQEKSTVPKIQLAVVALLRRPDAVAAEVGLDTLDHFAEHGEEESLRLNALAGLVERGQRERLNAYLRQLQSFPTGRGSGEALRILSRPEFADERVATIMIDLWGRTDGAHHVDLVRALAVCGRAEAASFLQQIAQDESVEVSLRQSAATVLANFTPDIAVPLLLEFFQSNPSAGRASLVLPGLGRHVQDARADAFLRELAADLELNDAVRRILIDAIPLIYRAEGYDILSEMLATSKRIDVRRYLESTLWRYY